MADDRKPFMHRRDHVDRRRSIADHVTRYVMPVVDVLPELDDPIW